jgi:CBS domain-containing protein
MVTVGNLMQTEPVMVEVGTSVVETAKLMRVSNVESVLVTRQTQIIGLVEDIMSSPVPGIEEQQPLTEAADRMNKHRTFHVGGTRGGTVIGLVSVRDSLKPVSIDDFWDY